MKNKKKKDLIMENIFWGILGILFACAAIITAEALNPSGYWALISWGFICTLGLFGWFSLCPKENKK